MKLIDLQNKKILIIGAGIDGKATKRYLAEKLPGEHIDLVDQSDGINYLDRQDAYDVVVKSPGINPDFLHVPYTTSSNIFFANVKGMTIGVTGTKGKSTTSNLLYDILRAAGKKVHLVGNIGNPMLSELAISNTKDDIWVCELSSYMISDLAYSPHVSVFLNLFPEHMDYHGSVEDYYQAKLRVVAHARKKDFLIYNSSNERLVDLAKETKAKALPFVKKIPFPRGDIPILGEHNYDNVRAAVTVGEILEIDSEIMHTAVKQFKPLRHRLEQIGVYQGITFYDDAISTTPQSTIQAIKTLKNIGTVFLGGQNRGYDFSELADLIVKEEIPNIVLFPDSGESILQALKKRTKKMPNILKTDSNEIAVKFAYKYTKPDTICLMSPASPSYSIWKNFEARGDEFQKLVKAFSSRV